MYQSPKSLKGFHGWYYVHGITSSVLAIFVCGSLLLSLSTFMVSSSSMEPALFDGDLITIAPARLTAAYQRGDIVVLRSNSPSHGYAVKRLVGLPGENLGFVAGCIFVDGQLLQEFYLHAQNETFCSTLTDGPAALSTYHIPKQSYFVLGDNRKYSVDSRMWGPIPAESIKGPVLAVFHNNRLHANRLHRLW